MSNSLVTHMPFLKICGIKSRSELEIARSAGANAIGVIVGKHQPGRDFVTLETAVELIRSIPVEILGVVVTLETDLQPVIRLIETTKARAIQLHGEIDINVLKKLKKLCTDTILIKAYPLRSEKDFDYGQRYQPYVDGFLVDAVNPATGLVGGSGTAVNWKLASHLRLNYQLPMILAGGLTPDNVSEAIFQSDFKGVDVNSGVKGPDGNKDQKRVETFLSNARKAFAMKETLR